MGNKGLSKETTDRHESYGMVGISRVSSSGTHLFGSIARHRSFITLTVKRASRRRSLANDWYSAESLPLIEIEMSHTQFGELITSPGMGDGVPCTIRAVGGKMMEECPAPENIESKFADDLKETTKETVAELKALRAQLNESLLPGNKPLGKAEQRELLGKIESAIASIEDSIPFIEKSFGEEMEDQLNRAFGEVEAYAAHMIHNTGLKAIAAAQGGLPEFPTPGQAPQLPGKSGK